MLRARTPIATPSSSYAISDLDAAQLRHKVYPPVLAAKFAIDHHRKSDLLLHAHDVANRRILGLAQGTMVDRAMRELCAGIEQAGGRSRLPTWSARKTLLPWLCHRLAPAWTGRAAGWRLGYRTFMRVAAPACPGSGSTAIPAPRSNWARAFRGSRPRTRGPATRCRSSTRRPWRRLFSLPCR